MDLKKAKKSKNFTDQTDYSVLQKHLDTLFTLLNPVYAFRKIRRDGGVTPSDQGIKIR